ncbi:MAG: type I glyceraldehyde-3-phosphate dehydrogenase [Roseobacter sp.]
MTTRIGINGFGRIGRSFLRGLLLSGRSDLQVVAINDPAPAETLAHLFEYDSLHGPFPNPVHFAGQILDAGFGPIRISSKATPRDLAWSDVDIALESSGQFSTMSAALQHLDNGSSRVLLSAPAKDDAKTIVYGVNHGDITPNDLMISNASCTTNCLVPIAAVLQDTFGIERGMMTTVHCYTRSQSTHDGPHDDLYRARAAAVSMVPTTSGAAQALGKVLPPLAGRITSHAIRVPTPNVSCIDLTVMLDKDATPEQINAAFAQAADGAYHGIIGYTDRKLVSSDFKQNTNSAIFAADQTRVQDKRMARVLAWYDNEWGFAHRLADTAAEMGKHL